VDAGLASEQFGLAVPRGSGLRRQLNRALSQLIVEGFITRLYAKWMLDDSECGRAKMAAAVRTSGFGVQRMTSSNMAVRTVSVLTSLILYATVYDKLFVIL